MEFESDGRLLLDAFVSAVTVGANNNTYKFALARFLLEHCRSSHAGLGIRYAEIAAKFFEYYWMQECKSKFRQGPSSQTPVVIQIIRSRFTKKYYPQRFGKIVRTHAAESAECITEIKKRCFDDVVPRLEEDAERYFGKQRGGTPHKRIFYDYLAREYQDSADNKKIDPGGGIALNPHIADVLRENYEPLFRTVVLEWIKFLEKRNIGIPRLAQKICGKALGPRDQARFKRYLAPFADRCFYCGVELVVQDKSTHVDHVIPYDYVGDTDLWNLVLSCQKCNCTKSGNVPPVQYIRKLRERNENYRSKIPKLSDSLEVLNSAHDIEWHYKNARRHGYPAWSGPGMK